MIVESVRSAPVVLTFDAEEPSMLKPTVSPPAGSTSNAPIAAVMSIAGPTLYASWRETFCADS